MISEVLPGAWNERHEISGMIIYLRMEVPGEGDEMWSDLRGTSDH